MKKTIVLILATFVLVGCGGQDPSGNKEKSMDERARECIEAGGSFKASGGDSHYDSWSCTMPKPTPHPTPTTY